MTDPEPDAAQSAHTKPVFPRSRLSTPHPVMRLMRSLSMLLKKDARDKASPSHPKRKSSSGSASQRFASDNGARFVQSEDMARLTVSELMRPAHEMVYLSTAHSAQHNLELIERTRFSRYPLFADDGEILLGMIHFKDIFPLAPQGVDFAAIARKAIIVPPDTLVSDLFRRFRQGGSHFALVGYPGEHAEGFLTIDNLLGAMLGEIRDEFRHDGGNWNYQDDGTLLGKGSLSLFSLKRALDIELPETEVDSVGGLVMAKLERLPKEGERISFTQFDIVIKRMHGPRILLLKVIPLERNSPLKNQA